MEIIGPIILTSIASISTLLGYLFVYFKVKNINKYICISLSFSGSIMLLISLKELLPISIKYIFNNNNVYNAITIIILIPIIINIITNILNKKINNTNTLYRVGVVSLITIITHNILEGIITFYTSIINIKLGTKLALAIMLHNIPEGIIISIPIYYSTNKRGITFKYVLISSLSELFGALLIYLLFKSYINSNIINLLLYIVGSLMIIISIKEIFKEALKYKNIIWILIGISLSLLILII